MFIAVLFVCFFLPEITDAAEEYSVEEQIAQFPESYQPMLWEIHAVYPNYSFQADYVNLTFDDAVYYQTLDHRKLVNMAYDGVSWRSLDPACYNAGTGTWSTFSGNWTDAGIDVIEYYMDPRNFLDTQNMYMFVKQTYTGSESWSGVASIAGSSFLSGSYTDSTGTHNYIDAIMAAAAESNVSPYVIAATLRIEQPYSGQSALIDGSRGYYNFFNFNAAGSDVVGNGINFAKSQGWNTVYKSIVGGAKIYYQDYLQYGQDTYFYKDFNVINGNFDHQYAQGVYDPISSATFLKNALSPDTGASLVLRIPVYQSMWDTPPSYPPKTGNLNTRYLIGATQTGWVLQNGLWYYIEENGAMKHGWLKTGGAWYYLDADGVMQTGWTQVGGKWYYMDSSGARKSGWLKDGGAYYYLDSDGVMQTGWLYYKNNWYYLNSSGVLQTGWQTIDGVKYYFKKGVMQTGWLNAKGKWFLLGPSGALSIGWAFDGYNWYFFNSKGVMQTGWIKNGGELYYLASYGGMQTGWVYYSGNWYFLKSSGAMARSEWANGYWLGADGKWTYEPIGSWQYDSRGWWYGDTSGWYARGGVYRIDGVNYTFDAAGYLAG